jgi:glutathione synthase/RimK-type ligase-like ATP-grasp enzyme
MSWASPSARSIAFVTSSVKPDINADDALAARSLSRHGLPVVAAPWDDPAIDWGRFSAVLLRSCWNYHAHIDRFLAWIAQLERDGIRLWNGPAVVRWNATKEYLRTLTGGGFVMPDTQLLERGSRHDLRAVVERNGWAAAVVKPTISADGHRTFRTDALPSDDNQRALDEILDASGAMIQRFVPAIETDGELSLIFFDGRFSHAALRRPAAGDFRVQERFGGTAAPATPPTDLVERAAALLVRAPEPCLYARIDVVDDGASAVIMEFEAIEPSLYLAHSPAAADRFAAAIRRWLERPAAPPPTVRGAPRGR